MTPAFIHSVPTQVRGPDRKDAKGGIPASSARVIPDAGRFALRSLSPACKHFSRL